MTIKPNPRRDVLENALALTRAVIDANKAFVNLELPEVKQIHPHLYKTMPILLKTVSRLEFHIAKAGKG